MTKKWRGHLRFRERAGDEQGAITLTVALGMTVLLGSAALAIDLGHTMAVRTESQRTADLAALAGAGAYIQSAAANVTVAVDGWAKDFALRNSVNNTPVSLLTSDIGVNVADEQVSVTVQHTAARGNAIEIVFGGALGRGSVDVVTEATAEASPALSVYCVLPFFLVDRWNELGGNPNRFDPGIDYYEAYDPAAPTTTYTGYDQGHVGVRLIIDPASANPADAGRPNSTWYYPFAPAALPGGPGSYQVSIEGCVDPNLRYDWGTDMLADPTPQTLATNLALQYLVSLDPQATWDLTLRCVVDASLIGLGDPTNCRSSPRIRPALLIDPGQAPGSSQQVVNVRNLVGVFVEAVLNSEAAVYLMGYTGVQAARDSGGGFTPPMVRTLRLVK